MTGAFWEERIALHEVSFRSANETLWTVFADSGEAPLGGAYPFLCECGDRTCTQVVQVPLQLYAEVREHPARFLIVPGHRQLDPETIVDDGDGYEVVEKGRRSRRDRPRRLAAHVCVGW
jgi:hypothetical protein